MQTTVYTEPREVTVEFVRIGDELAFRPDENGGTLLFNERHIGAATWVPVKDILTGPAGECILVVGKGGEWIDPDPAWHLLVREAVEVPDQPLPYAAELAAYRQAVESLNKESAKHAGQDDAGAWVSTLFNKMTFAARTLAAAVLRAYQS